jgi:hypothetical protein
MPSAHRRSAARSELSRVNASPISPSSSAVRAWPVSIVWALT